MSAEAKTKHTAEPGAWIEAPDGYREDGTPRPWRRGKVMAVKGDMADVWWDDDGTSSWCSISALRALGG